MRKAKKMHNPCGLHATFCHGCDIERMNLNNSIPKDDRIMNVFAEIDITQIRK